MPSAKVAALLAANGIEVEDDEFSHYGVPGMKWGVRNDNSDPGGVGPFGERPSKDLILEKGFVSIGNNGSASYVGGNGPAGGGGAGGGGDGAGESFDEYWAELEDILAKENLTSAERDALMKKAKEKFLTKSAKQGVPILIDGKMVSVKTAMGGSSVSGVKPGDFIKDVTKSVRSKMDELFDSTRTVGKRNTKVTKQGQVNKFVEDSAKNVGSFVDTIVKKAQGK